MYNLVEVWYTKKVVHSDGILESKSKDYMKIFHENE